MECIKILYIDDKLDIEFSKFLDQYKKKNEIPDIKIEVEEVQFYPKDGYDALLKNKTVSNSNIIFIDSKLFENNTAVQGKFTGEEFKLILKKYFPFIEVFVITQKDIEPDYAKIAKYDINKAESANIYYWNTIPLHIKEAISKIQESRLLLKKIEENKQLEAYIIEKIANSLNGINLYDELSKQDLDEIITLFKEIQESINGK